MRSCRGNEFNPLFGAYDSESGESAKASDSSAHGSEAEDDDVVAEAFAEAKDKWKIDSQTLKGFYFHSSSKKLYGWEQACGLLYEYNREVGSCSVIWGAGTPAINAEIWTVLPLPPTDPASLQAAPTIPCNKNQCILHLQRFQAARRAQQASEDFCSNLELDHGAVQALLSLPPAGQSFLVRTFCPPDGEASLVSGVLRRQVAALRAAQPPPWSAMLEVATLQVPESGAILGRCIPDIAALCWDEDDAVAQAHCRVAVVSGRFCVCDLEADEDGVLYDGRRLGSDWVALRDGCHIGLGPVDIRVELAPVRSELEVWLSKRASLGGADNEEGGIASLLRRKRKVLDRKPIRKGKRRGREVRTWQDQDEYDCVSAQASAGAARPFWKARSPTPERTEPTWIPRTPP